MNSNSKSLGYISNQPLTKDLSTSCQTCHRLAEIEGETVCFRQGEIIKLKKIESISKPEINFLCEGWKGKSIAPFNLISSLQPAKLIAE